MSTTVELDGITDAALRVFGDDVSGENVNEMFAEILTVNGSWMSRVCRAAHDAGASLTDVECLIDAAAAAVAGAVWDAGLAGFHAGRLEAGDWS